MADDREFWLGHCEGFEVRAGDRLVGVVEYVRYGSSHDRPDAVYTRCGTFRTRVLEVPVADVADLDPPMETLWISEALATTPPFASVSLRSRVRDSVRTRRDELRASIRAHRRA